ncbi:MAG: hypothetical protein WA110_10775, partial [Anaerolineaceae bacterium]
MEPEKEPLSTQGLGENPEPQPTALDAGSFFTKAWARLVQFGLGERTLRLGSVLFTALLFIVIVLVMGRFYASVSGGAASDQV